MAVNESRDMIADLQLGSTEGRYKTYDPDRGGEINLETRLQRRDLFRDNYDFEEVALPARALPTGRWSKHTSGRGGNTY